MKVGVSRGSRRIVWTIPLLIAVVVVIVGWWTRYEVYRTIQGKLKGELDTVLQANVTALEVWMNNQERMAETIAGDPSVRELSLALLEQNGSRKLEPRLLAEWPQMLEFEKTIMDRIRRAGFLSAQVVATNCTIVGMTGRGRLRSGMPVNEAHKAKFEELFASGNAVIITPFKLGPLRGIQLVRGGRKGPPHGEGGEAAERPPQRPPTGPGEPPPGGLPGLRAGLNRDANLMQVAAPLRDKHGTLVGALAFIIRPEDEFTKVLSVARTGVSGETFAFDQNGLMISQSRFDAQLKELGLLKRDTNVNSSLTLELRDPGGNLVKGYRPTAAVTNWPLVPMIADAVEGGSGVNVEPSRDYRGVPVVGAWCWLPKEGFGVATKIDAAEAYQPLSVLRLIFISLILLLALCTTVIVLFSYVNQNWRRKFDEAQLRAKHLGQYTLQEKIGEGGMGVVYRANHALLRRETAIKLLTPDRADASSIRRFEREVQLTCQLTHPNTIQIYDYGHTPDGIFYYAMEFLRGLSVADLVAQYGPQPEARVVHVLLQVCESLGEAHAIGLVHRDIKPGNIFLCERGGVPDTVKVLDFGLVKVVDRPEQRSLEDEHFEADLVGSPLFLPPEAIRNPKESDQRSDIYAMGAVGYFALTGKHVFEGDSVRALCKSHLVETPVSPSARRGEAIGAELEKLILRCLAKDPAQRPQTVAELHAALLACAAGAPWTLEMRTAWWTQHHTRPKRATAPAEKGSTSTIDATVRIDVAARRTLVSAD